MQRCSFFLKMTPEREDLNRSFALFCLSQYKKSLTESIFGFLKKKSDPTEKVIDESVKSDYDFDLKLSTILNLLTIKIDIERSQFWFEIKEGSIIQNINAPVLFKSLFFSYKYPDQAAAFQKGEIKFFSNFFYQREKFYRDRLKQMKQKK